MIRMKRISWLCVSIFQAWLALLMIIMMIRMTIDGAADIMVLCLDLSSLTRWEWEVPAANCHQTLSPLLSRGEDRDYYNGDHYRDDHNNDMIFIRMIIAMTAMMMNGENMLFARQELPLCLPSSHKINLRHQTRMRER